MKIVYKVNFDKEGPMRFISHLDLMRLFERALRRADFGLYLTQGFNPHPIIRINRALKLGLEAKGMEAEFVLNESISPDSFKSRLNNELPDGVKIKDVRL